LRSHLCWSVPPAGPEDMAWRGPQGRCGAGLFFLPVSVARQAKLVTSRLNVRRLRSFPFDDDANRRVYRPSGVPPAWLATRRGRVLARGLFPTVAAKSFGGASIVTEKETGHVTPWTNEHLRQLRVYSKAGTPLREIAKKMERTEGALRRKAGILGIGLRYRRAGH
jgi:hypothetical protein